MRIAPSLSLVIVSLFLALPIAACTDSTAGDDKDTDPPKMLPEVAHAALVSNWLNRSLEYIDLDKLREGGSAEDATVARLDLSAYPIGPLNTEITPDGSLALVSLSTGFFSIPFAGTVVGADAIPTEPGLLLFVDLKTLEVVGELDVGSGPMGIAITHDGTLAYVANFGTTTMTVVDIEARSIVEQVEVGIYAEEIALDETGSVGIFSYSAAGNFRTFGASDFAGTLSDDVALTGDAAGVAFFPGTKVAYVVQAAVPVISPMGGHTIVDVADPENPVVLEDVRVEGGAISYPAAPVPSRNSVVVPTALNGVLAVDEIKLSSDDKAEVVQTIEVGSASLFGAYGATVDLDGRLLLSIPAQHLITVVDLEQGTHFSVSWPGDQPGPTDIALIP